jgi:hypothetical protein
MALQFQHQGIKKSYFALVFIIFLLSFRAYSSLYYPALNSDNAVGILMLHYFHLPDDLYPWGQNRMGSLIPLLGQVFFKLFNLSAIASESITHYLILLAGYLAFASFVKSYFYKVAFAIIWFFPPMRLIDITQFAFGIHYSLIGIGCYFIALADRFEARHNSRYQYALLIAAAILLITAVWVSDMAVVSVILLAIVHVLIKFKDAKNVKYFLLKNVLPVFVAMVAGYFFISYAKSTSPFKNHYATFSDINEIAKSINIFFLSVWDFFLFNASELYTSIYAYLATATLVTMFVLYKSSLITKETKKWLIFFLADAILLWMVIMVSKWTFTNDVPRRYFTCTYISLSFVIILVADNMQLKKQEANIIKALMLVTLLAGAISTPHDLLYGYPKRLTSRAEIAQQFNSLGRIGIIGDYWNSYVNSCVNPDSIVATPNDKSYIRRQEFVTEVLKSENIYVIRDMWMDSFPDTLLQFNHTLLKEGEEFYLGDSFVCRYKIVH